MGPRSTGPLDNEITFSCYLNFRPQFSQERSWCLAVSLGHSLLPVADFPSGGRSRLDSGSVVVLLSIMQYNHRLAATWLDVMRGSGMVWVTRIIGISSGMWTWKNSLPSYNANVFPRCAVWTWGSFAALCISQLVKSRVVPTSVHLTVFTTVCGQWAAILVCAQVEASCWGLEVELVSWVIHIGPFIFKTRMIFALLNILISEAKKEVL